MRPIIAGNWKMHHGPEEAARFGEALGIADLPPVELVLFPPAISLAALRKAVPEGVALGCQNVHWEDRGAFTGETSVEMVRGAGAEFVLVGHSERRHVFGETDDQVAKKMAAVLRADLVPVLCVGETLGERRDGRLEEVLLRQLDAVLDPPELRSLLRDGGQRMVLAYEPVWAIGTGETATPADATEAHGILARRLLERLGKEGTNPVPILYGGSVKPGNAGELMGADRVDGVLVGGASLDSKSFLAIARSVA
ncbi:MAG: triose-phosphate isomerase [Gemmatimonadales bacterium]|nr:MAG: triose-phosphate isomerase [Gemmatimonadales bacterium]